MKEKVPGAPMPVRPESVPVPSFDFHNCVNIEELYEKIDEMESNGQVLRGSSQREFSPQEIRKMIAEVRKARQQGIESLAQDVLSRITNTAGLRDAIDRIVHGDSYVGDRERSETEGSDPSKTDLDIHL